ncbi:MAG: phosphate acyltransferase PlsX [Chloroflexi bacterium]|nr:phosphate acyltransferase PlsX [Chloroflexota bacterium]
MRIVLDVMGGDHAPGVVIDGAIQAHQAYPDTEIVLVGPEDRVRAELAQRNAASLPFPIVHASQVVEMEEHPALAVKAKPDSTIIVGMDLVRKGDAAAFASAGNTGAVMAGALFRLGRLPGIKRPALGTIYPTRKGFCLILDMGANTDCKPEWLIQFAIMGVAYAEKVMGISRPSVGLISNGEEETKGSQLVQETHQILKEMQGQGLVNFVGNVEGKDISTHLADVVVTDGFTGNVIVKLSEGLSGMIKELINEEIRRDPLSMVGGLLAKRAFSRVSKRTDYSEFGGAPLLGVNGVVIIGHGRSNSNAIKNMIRVARQAVQQGIQTSIQAGIAQVPVKVTESA